ncbi:2-succinyl-5-enolpyruvyl-6-hydroxy-3-cyclohexene -1-carboxylate synthase [Leptolyngbya boryana NIES-2135]|jgi:2-succinyl-5-enolpyruvyl-6-hydroxy-3-cyclohexene-1-carboxylate synthase|uniref:2-succinyl-5-enolpyruvyl-6-hydroxy-3-cyclohexene-1-carboxylate synthase n=1 Tax=Leptolyngbya boryana NIES-2135 TaxID=1973484 RepID=A0A1Z4JBT0_LEPBY|nr:MULTISPECIES: 2-succinyl-5-enolpyruvyl-6-hydroxy-3-cyclohexene-1-carboxylic-acid synthase [Leptolyngbya]BAY54212.1 2-succinyl-5-enolpyruvyl-6-hydroxy-3-cyclohexene -1-carboxylate synthase [Leptolyngbya boryana NIES-2135]MBD2370275.1 2-succinyl-5-enolpyruvyl-6-hydroxy-3-cyclohexene-1-carboxylic-acid synthase [Leptolyngbya sp. FACHB-161]MBD2376621.1 2-succinyl-5-enolpyruvyl-6-hydroxy-3-cyclohexene-1-carboxylic-acid synthase [Leptolyngbya sp. FACHB-238]MBD2400893.1 2-succinyl-5-enolpyruvyl-6-hy
MNLDFRNINTLWASVLVETLARSGLKTAIICPGSRSTPLTVAFARHPDIEAIPILDERSASFFALGIARRTHQPVVLVCTSGSAGANFFPAVVEARESRVPLLVLTADRPPELRNCNAGQAIDQQKLFGSFTNFYTEITIPELSLLSYLRQTVLNAIEQTQYPIPGVVHLNLPFREPLAPIEQSGMPAQLPANFFEHLSNSKSPKLGGFRGLPDDLATQRGIIIAGVSQPKDLQKYCESIALLSKSLSMPVFAEALSPLRNFASLNPYLISTYDTILRNKELAKNLAPEVVIRIGEMPTSKEVRLWLEQIQPLQYVLDPSDRSLDPLHSRTIHIRLSIEDLQTVPTLPITDFLKDWLAAESKMRQIIDQSLAEETALFEGKSAWLLSQTLPPDIPLFIASSMPVRDAEFFWKPGDLRIQPFFNRGANGIDGTLSTALGIAHHQTAVMLTGDLALLHDTNGFLMRSQFKGHLTIVLINNNGGGIFGMLPIAPFDPPFEEFFATPQNIDFSKLCQTYDVKHEIIETWDQLRDRLNPLPPDGIRVLELRTDRHHDANWRKTKLKHFANLL